MIITNFHESMPIVDQVICQNKSVEWQLPGVGGVGERERCWSKVTNFQL